MAPDVPEVSHTEGVHRRNCPKCGTPLTARFGYLPGQVYVPVGILDEAAALAPQVECHVASHLPWVPIDPDLPASDGSARETLQDPL